MDKVIRPNEAWERLLDAEDHAGSSMNSIGDYASVLRDFSGLGLKDVRERIHWERGDFNARSRAVMPFGEVLGYGWERWDGDYD